MPAKRFIPWLGIARSKFHDWRRRYGRVNEHNALVPRDHWIEPWERQAIIRFYLEHRTDGYRRVTFMMLDLTIVAVSPATTWRVLSREGLMRRWNAAPSKKGTGFEQPLAAHEHWHVDISYLNISGTFFYLVSVLDGYSRFIVAWDIRASMTECDVEIVMQRARERFPQARPRVISDNGPQFIANDFKEFIRVAGMTHARTSTHYPQSNGKAERWHRTLKTECIRPQTPLSVEQALPVVERYVHYYNHERLHSAIGFIAPRDKLDGRAKAIFEERDRKLEAARETRRRRRLEQRTQTAGARALADLTFSAPRPTIPLTGETETGSAGEQPVRDTRSRSRRSVPTEAAVTRRLQAPPGASEIPPMPQKTQPSESPYRQREKPSSR